MHRNVGHLCKPAAATLRHHIGILNYMSQFEYLNKLTLQMNSIPTYKQDHIQTSAFKTIFIKIGLDLRESWSLAYTLHLKTCTHLNCSSVTCFTRTYRYSRSSDENKSHCSYTTSFNFHLTGSPSTAWVNCCLPKLCIKTVKVA